MNTFTPGITFAPHTPTPSGNERKKINYILVCGYTALNLLALLLPASLPDFAFLLWVILLINGMLGYEVYKQIKIRSKEKTHTRNLRILNPFHYKPTYTERIVNAFVETIAPETEMEMEMETYGEQL